jgi:formylmethanofuran dehydrogenase subunit B
MTMPAEIRAQRPTEQVAHATCLGCGCLCDDIALAVAAGRIVEAKNACERGQDWFLTEDHVTSLPAALIEGRPAMREEALDRAARILGAARAPLVMGLTATSLEAQAAALAVAERIGAVVCPAHFAESAPQVRAFERVGRVGATLGEVKNRADVVVFWGVDPVITHPRHWERYSVEPRGRFVPQGRAGRTVLVADAERTATAERADHFLQVNPEQYFTALWTLRALVRGAAAWGPHSPSQGESGFVPLEFLSAWAELLKRARYGAFFFGPSLGRARGGAATVEAALRLVRDLNAHTRFVALPLGAPGNAAGVEAVLTWQTGYALGVDFRLGYPRALDGNGGAAALLARHEADAALIVADEPSQALPQAALAHLSRVPHVVLGPRATAPGSLATVALATAKTGIHAGGTVIRADGVSLPLRPALTSALPTDRALLCALETRLKAASSTVSPGAEAKQT